MSHATATKTAAKKPAKKKVSAFSTRKVDPAYYWMVVPAVDSPEENRSPSSQFPVPAIS